MTIHFALALLLALGAGRELSAAGVEGLSPAVTPVQIGAPSQSLVSAPGALARKTGQSESLPPPAPLLLAQNEASSRSSASRTSRGRPSGSGTASDLRAAGLSPAQQARVTPVVEVVRSNRGAVVNISATQIVQVRDLGFGRLLDYFDTPFSRQMKTNSVGSGAVIHSSGYVLTNAHVVAQASELKVIFADGMELPGEVVATLPEEDLAIVRVQPPAGKKLQAVRLGTSSDLMVGESVVAIGNPLGLAHSVTTGIISAVGRELPMSSEVVFHDIIQTDAAINPGNSGGPLLNILGELIGVNTAIRGDAQNVGFAIPVDRVKALLPDLLRVENQGRIRFGLLWGSEEATTSGIRGVKVAFVEPGSPAHTAGLRAGAVVSAIAGKRTAGIMDALIAVLEQPVGRPFEIYWEKGGKRQRSRISLQELPPPNGSALAQRLFGVELREIDESLARRLGLRPKSALIVTAVEPQGPASRGGLEVGDLVTQVGRFGVKDLKSLGLILENVRSGDSVFVTRVRIRGHSMYRSGSALLAR